MTSWYKESEESLRGLAQERLQVQASELIHEAMERRSTSQVELAERIGVKRSEISQRLTGKRNLTLKSFADMLHAMGMSVRMDLEEERPATKYNVISLEAARTKPQHVRYREGNVRRTISSSA